MDWEVKYIDKEVSNEGKITKDKLNYELDFEFLTGMAERMKLGKQKYAPYSWQKSTNIEDLKQGLFRHCLAIMKGETTDDGQELGHLYAIAVNSMFIAYQIKRSIGKI